MPSSTISDVENSYSHNEQNLKFRELMYSFNSFTAVLWPVSVTMICTALAVTFINDGSNGNGKSGLGVLPQVSSGDEGDEVKDGFLSALIIIGAIIGMTFFMVLLYYFECIKFLVFYLVCSTALLLSITSSFVVTTAFAVYEVPFDQITFWFFFYNFAVCGVLSIFYQKGLPQRATQTYLVLVSVVMAWLLLKLLPEWVSWSLLLLLAVYDLCAVLTPCGPLKCLIELAQDREVMLPGLLYEADVQNQHTDSNNGALTAQAEGDVEPRRQNDVAGAAGIAPFAGIIMMMADRGTVETSSSSSSTNLEDDDNASEEGVEMQRSSRHRELPPEPKEYRRESLSSSFADRNSIKLGLGDFVFYSVLIGRAALNGFSTFVAVYLTIVSGLGMTLFLLAVYQKALPALPISIFIGLILYFVTDTLVTPMVNELALTYTSL